MNAGLMVGDRALTVEEFLEEKKEEERAKGRVSPKPEDLEQSWQDLARKTKVGEVLSQKAKDTKDTLLAGKLLALGVGATKDILAGVATLDSRITKLHLNQKELTDKHAKELGASLAKNPHITDLSLQGNKMTEKGLETLLKGLDRQGKDGSKVTSLNLEGNPVTLRKVKTIRPFLRLTSLNLSQTAITDKDMESLLIAPLANLNVARTALTEASGEAVLQKLRESLRTLNVSHTQTATGIIRGLHNNRKLTALDMSHMKIADVALADLVQALLPHPTLKVLSLRVNSISRGRSLADLLQRNAVLSTLDLSNNGLGLDHEGIENLAQGLKKNSTLEELNLSYNFIKDRGAQALYKSILNHPTLRVLNLDYNGDMSDKTREKFRQLQDLKPLLHVSLKKVYEAEM
jgi:Ran GTPase-activating protein (RanGAP) involved in mRNA processing and transport